MKKRLSSILVPFYKLTLVIVVAVGVISVIRSFPNFSIVGLLFFIVWCVVWYAVTWRWKSVYLENDFLWVSNNLKKIRIPLSNIALVERSCWWLQNVQTIKLHLKEPSAFGETIIFVPRLGGFAVGEITDELKELIAANERLGS